MKLKHSLLAVAFATSALLAVNANAQDPTAKTPDMKGHDMSSMQGQDMKGHDMAKKQGHDMKGQSAGSMELHKIMSSGMKMPMKMTGNVDKDFASMMSMHHQQAIRMADVLIKNGRNAELKALASKMKAAQQGEIKQLAAYTK